MTNALYVENGVGRRFTDAFNQFQRNHGWSAYFQHTIHPAMQQPQTDDVWWIEDVGNRGYVILTCDLAILRSTDEEEALRQSAGRLVGFADGQYTAWQMMRAVTWHWDGLVNVLQRGQAVAVKLYASTKRPEVRWL